MRTPPRTAGFIFILVSLIGLWSHDASGHGPYPSYMEAQVGIDPAHPTAFAAGELGIVRPWFRRRYLMQAFRVAEGRAAAPAAALREWEITQQGIDHRSTAFDDWITAKYEALGKSPSPNERGLEYFSRERHLADYQTFENCNEDAFASAMRTLNDRKARYGAKSAQVASWMRAQIAVFDNCSGTTPVLPAAAPANADALTRADRAYQTAAAYFYATHYEEAAARFTAIAADVNSPWRPYGRYLTGRALIRRATIGKMNADESYALAAREFNAVLSDQAAAALHASARGLLQFIAFRVRPDERLTDLSTRLIAADVPTARDIFDFQLLMDHKGGSGPGISFDIEDPVLKGNRLTDWIITIQSSGQAAFDRALTRWTQTKSTPWLVAVMWKITPEHPELNTVLRAAATIRPEHPLYPTVAFLRARLLIAAGRIPEARTLLDSVKNTPQLQQLETANAFAMLRFRTARTFDELLAAAPRALKIGFYESYARTDLREDASVAFDYDGADVFNERLPLSMLLQASRATTLTERMRVKVAMAGLTRAMVLRRDADGVEFARVLVALRPALSDELTAYIDAPTADDRRIAAVYFVAHTLGASAFIPPLEDDLSAKRDEPRRTANYEGIWWCSGYRSDQRFLGLMETLYGGTTPYPAFVTAAQRAAAERELDTINKSSGRTFVTAEAIRWARLRPKDVRAAEVLAIAINRGRYSCADPSGLSRVAFGLLHRQYPDTEWAKRTKYWYP